jgi:plastocyanin
MLLYTPTCAHASALNALLFIAICSVAKNAQAANHDPVADEPSAKEVVVDIGPRHFDPPVVYIRPGVKVTWFNGSYTPHGVRGGNFDFHSPPLRLGKKFSRVFDEPGIYEYYCPVHTSNSGRVVVIDPE